MTPGLFRRLLGLLYEALMLTALALLTSAAFLFASGGADATRGGVPRHALQLLLVVVFATYLLGSWLLRGQTLAMKAWRMRLVGVTPARAVARFLLAATLLPVSILWALVDRDRQFLHDRLAGTRLVLSG